MDDLDNFERELKEEFNSLGIQVNYEIISLCSIICKRNNVTPNDLVESWVAFSLVQWPGQDLKPSSDNLLLLESKELGKKTITVPKTVLSSSPPPSFILPPVVDILVEEANKSVETVEEKAILNIETNSKNIFPPEIVHVYGNAKDNYDLEPVDIKPLIAFDTDKDKCMYNKIIDEINILMDSTYQIIDTIKNSLQISELDDNDDCYFGGRIMASAAELKSNPSNIKFYCLDLGDVLLDVSQLNDYSLFPGQVLVVKGNKSGHKLIASDIYDNGSLPLSNSISFQGKIQVLVAAGPFIESDNYSFDSLTYMAQCVNHMNPQAFIILGPLINSKEFPSPSSVNFTALYRKIIQYLAGIINTNIQIYCVVHKLDRCWIPVYPTLPSIGKDQKVTLLSDPAQISINGVIVGLSSSEVLQHTMKHELNKNCSNERFLRLCHHCLKQQTFYPLYPPDLSINMDYKLARRYAKFTHSPHIIFFRSIFKYFIKECTNKSIFINPGCMSPKKDRKTFALFEVYGSNSTSNNSNTTTECSDNWCPSESLCVKIFKA